MKKTQSKGMSAGKMVSIGAGAVALGAAAYYFLGPKAKKQKEGAKKWAMDAKKKIVGELKRSKTITKNIYENIVDDVLKPYVEKGATSQEVKALATALKKDWSHISKASKEAVKNQLKGK
ncbi:MAG: hypothetical protein V4486_02690 [Patescibacteria group bacterium]